VVVVTATATVIVDDWTGSITNQLALTSPPPCHGGHDDPSSNTASTYKNLFSRRHRYYSATVDDITERIASARRLPCHSDQSSDGPARASLCTRSAVHLTLFLTMITIVEVTMVPSFGICLRYPNRSLFDVLGFFLFLFCYYSPVLGIDKSFLSRWEQKPTQEMSLKNCSDLCLSIFALCS